MTDHPASAGAPTSAAGPGRLLRRRRDAFRAWPRSARVAAYLALALALVLVAGLLTGVAVLRRPLPTTTGTVPVPGLAGEVEVVRDAYGVPQLYGDSVDDLLRAQGWVHASERFFEMDVRRHATAGRLAELFGEPAVESDALVRTLGWRRVAERELALVRPETRAALEAYAAGVNAYLADRSPAQLAIEYTLLNLTGLDYHPEPWTPVDSLAWLKAMAWDLRGNMAEEIDRALATAAVGAERTRELHPDYPYDAHAPVVRQGAVVDGVYEPEATTGGTRNPRRPAYTAAQRAALADVERVLAATPAWLGRGDGLGSNAWAVSGEHTATGAPLLANDPHLGVSLPSVWTQTGLHCREVDEDCPLDVAGFGFAGVPGVVIGHNADLAWGFTNLGPDVTDLYLERVVGDRWRHDGELRPLRVRTETIRVAGGEDVVLTVRETAHGPLLSDVSEVVGEVADAADMATAAGAAGAGPGTRAGAEVAVALAWTALDPRPTADAILALATAHDWDSFRAAASSFAVPGQNLVYADREGHIGYQATGRVPIRKSGNDGTVPAQGWRPEDDWTGQVVPFDGLPQVLDPDEGFVVSANQAVVGEDYPFHLTDDWARGYRSQRIRRLLEAEIDGDGTVSVADMLAIQLDDENLLAPVLAPRLLDVELPEGYYSDGQRLLADWDFGQDADSAPAAYFNVVWRNLLALTFHDELPEEAWPDGGQRWYAVVTRLLEDPANPWWDDVTTEAVEQRDDVLAAAQLAARDELTRRLDRVAGQWEWGRLHTLALRSPTLGESGNPVAEWLLNRGPWQVAGGTAAVNATGWDATEGYEVRTAPSMRMVVSLADLDDSRWINLAGVSGHPASDHYTDQTELWVDGETLPWPFSAGAVEEAAEDTMVLEPAPGDE